MIRCDVLELLPSSCLLELPVQKHRFHLRSIFFPTRLQSSPPRNHEPSFSVAGRGKPLAGTSFDSSRSAAEIRAHPQRGRLFAVYSRCGVFAWSAILWTQKR